MRVLVTGSKGFIGSHLVPLLDDVVEYDLKQGQDILEKYQLEEASEGCDAVIHLAALCVVTDSLKRPAEYIRNNVVGTANVMSLGLPTIVASSWVAENPTNPYAISKRATEYLAQGHCVLRFFNVYGTNMNPQYGRVTQAFIDGVRKGEVIIYGDGTQTRDFVHVTDVCNAILTALKTNAKGTFDVGSGVLTSMNELKDLVFDLMHPVRVTYLPARDEPIEGMCAVNTLYQPKMHMTVGLVELLK